MKTTIKKMKMMKNLSLSALMALMALMTGCQKEETGLSPQTNEVTFNLAVDNATRSGSDDPTRYIMEIYTDINAAYDSRVEQATGSFTVSLKENEEYTILFYADYGSPQGSDNEYNATNLKALQVAKQPTKACFAGSVNFTYDSQAEAVEKTYLNPTLTHAVSQVNFVQGAEDFLEGDNELKVTLPKAYSYSVYSGAVSEIASSQTLYTFSNIAKENSNQTIGQSYIFANPSAQTVMNGVKIKFNEETEKSLDNVPFQANHKTNINGLYNNVYNSTFTAESNADWYLDIDKDVESRTISGIATDESDDPLNNITIEVFKGYQKIGQFTTDGDGNFVYELPKPVNVGDGLTFTNDSGELYEKITSIPMTNLVLWFSAE